MADPVIQAVIQDISSTPMLRLSALRSRPNTTMAELSPARLRLSLPAEPRTREQNNKTALWRRLLLCWQQGSELASIPHGGWNGCGTHAQLHWARASAEQVQLRAGKSSAAKLDLLDLASVHNYFKWFTCQLATGSWTTFQDFHSIPSPIQHLAWLEPSKLASHMLSAYLSATISSRNTRSFLLQCISASQTFNTFSPYLPLLLLSHFISTFRPWTDLKFIMHPNRPHKPLVPPFFKASYKHFLLHIIHISFSLTTPSALFKTQKRHKKIIQPEQGTLFNCQIYTIAFQAFGLECKYLEYH